jgi:hypothetical protein
MKHIFAAVLIALTLVACDKDDPNVVKRPGQPNYT